MAAGSAEPTQLPARSGDVRYRLVALSSDVVDIVSAAGGWLFDRALAGCDVIGLVAHHHDDLPLRILGVKTASLDDALALELCDVGADALAVSADLYRRDPRVHQGVLDCMDAGMTNVIMWGNSWPSEMEGLVSSVHHPLSLAARAFKMEALRAAAAPVSIVDSVELFRGVDVRTCQAACAHLVTAS